MADKKGSIPAGKPAQTREDRLKAALKANLARRKAQSRARTQDSASTATPDGTGQDKDA